jgi:hypothetical protein
MTSTRPLKIVVLGMIGRSPVAGMVWLTMQYVLGLTRLGHDVYYAEAHAGNPSTFMTSPEDDGAVKAAAFIDGAMRRFGLPNGHWAFHALHADRACYGLSDSALKALYQTADLVINLHGATHVGPQHSDRDRLLLIETDPMEFAVRVANNDQTTIEFLEPHRWFFTWGENYGNADCLTPHTARFAFKPTRQPVVMDLWESDAAGPAGAFTTIASWRQARPDVQFGSDAYRWSKHDQFMRVIDLPGRTTQDFELMLASCPAADRALLEARGWSVREDAASLDVDAYRRYITGSRGEFTVAKDRYVRPRTGWFSDRTATYLAAGRPVITENTGFSNHLPTGEGLMAFSTLDEALDAVECVNADYGRHCKAARDIAREFFSHDVVLPRLLAEAGV